MSKGFCEVNINNSITSRRCFMTGEYCSKQISVLDNREELRKNNAINAFIISNFSPVTDVLYKWKIQKFITELKKYLYISADGKSLRCYEYELSDKNGHKEEYEDLMNCGWKNIGEIHPVRADSTYATTFVMCNRVCQQMLTADLIIVDVSNNNANVFYELGLAMAMGKLILPICNHTSFYNRYYPTEEQKK